MQKCRISGSKEGVGRPKKRICRREKRRQGGGGAKLLPAELNRGEHIPGCLVQGTILSSGPESKPIGIAGMISTQFPKVTVGKTENKTRSREGKRINSAFIFGERKMAKSLEDNNFFSVCCKIANLGFNNCRLMDGQTILGF